MVLAGSACGSAAAAQTEVARQQPAAEQAACRAADLSAVFRGFQASGASLAGAVVVVNAGAGRCRLRGPVQSVAMRDADGSAVAARSRPPDASDAASVALPPGTSLPVFGASPPAGSAWFVVTWTNWCAGATPAVGSLVVGLAGGDSLTAPLDAGLPSWALGPPAPRCDDARAGSGLAAGRLQAATR